MDLLDKLSKQLIEANKSTKAGGFRVLSTSNNNQGGGDNGSQDGSGSQGGRQGGQQSGQGGGQAAPNGTGGGMVPRTGKEPKGSGGSGAPAPPNQQGQGKGGQGQPQPGQGGQGQGQPGQGQPGQGGQPGGQQPVKVSWKNGEMFINGKGTGNRQKDNHEGLGQGSIQDFDDIIRQTYNEVKERGGKSGSASAGSGKGNTMSMVEQYLKPKFNIKPILKRLDDFKRLIGKQLVEAKMESYAAAQHNPASQTGEMMRPSKIPGGKKRDVVKESAILIFSVDTSGSITQKDFQFIFGFLDKIEKHFAKPMTLRNDNGEKVGTLSGEVYLMEWDSGVHLPLRKWTQVQRGKMVQHVTPTKEEEAKNNKLRGGGGTNINKMFATLDKVFYREVKGKGYFDLDETSDYINISRNVDDADNKEKQKGAKKFRVPLKKQKRKQIKEIDKDRIEQDVDLTPGEPNFLEGRKKVANVPFLLIYTDGYFNTADYTISKLYADNPGNILYILTDRGGLENLRPVNVMFHDIHGQGDSFQRFSKKIK